MRAGRQRPELGLSEAAPHLQGHIYSVPVNIHRSNVLWYNPSLLEDAGIDGPPASIAEFIDALKAVEDGTQSIGVPLVIGGNAVPKRARELGVGALPLAMWNDFLFAGADGGGAEGLIHTGTSTEPVPRASHG